MRPPQVAPVSKRVPLPTGALLLGLALFVATGVTTLTCHAQGGSPAAVMGAGPAKAASGVARSASSAKSATSPLWSELTPSQQQALAPLAATWPTISEAQKRKWLVISQSYGTLVPSEQVKLHSRMNDWVALSPQQRIQARLNFAESKQLSPDDKKAKWEAYQALPPEEKRKLAAGAASAAKPPGTAPAVKPLPQKLATVPRTRDAKAPRIAAAPNQVDHNTLLPQPAAPASLAPSN
jgi:hypothetical protein